MTPQRRRPRPGRRPPRHHHGTVPVRDSEVPDGPALPLRTEAFTALVAGLKRDGVFGPARGPP
ncbi:DUF397 domain-containing protein [Streptomyces sp. SID9727]|nr:DUF397 domain-containing protein [Streptomyces sp. SID9727]